MNMELMETNKLKRAKILIYVASISIPLVVAILFGIPKIKGVDTHFLPPLYASMNGLTAVLLIAALIAIKKKNKSLHQLFIRMSLVLSLLFLACYVTYHLTSEATVYGGSSVARKIYLFILASHILLSVAVIPLVLFTYLFAWQGDFIRHKKWTRFSWPIWMYVAVTGVVVYLMISPFYNSP
jgi:putative membrane protein